MKPTRLRRQRPRGYLLIEALVGSAVLTVALVSVYHQMGLVDWQLSAAARKLAAEEAVVSGISRYRAQSFTTISCTTCETNVAVNGDPEILRTTVISGVLTAPTCDGCKRITVTVKYKNASRVQQQLQAQTFLSGGF